MTAGSIKATGLSEALELVRPAHDPALVSPAMLDRVEQVARLLAPVHRAGFECRLEASDPQVDFQQCILAPDGEPAVLADAIANAAATTGRPLSPAWQSILALCREWSTQGNQFAEVLQELWLEFDVPETPVESLIDLRPSVFVRFRKASGTLSLQVAASVLTRLVPDDDAGVLRAALERCAAACVQPAWVSHIGVMLGRDSPGIRINVMAVPVEEMAPFLERVGWPGDGASISRLAEQLLQFVDSVVICLAVREAVHPRLGLECFFAPRPDLDARLPWLLGDMLKRGLCTPEKRDALLAWPGMLTPPEATAAWPGELIVRDLLGPPSRLGALERRWSHVKLDCTTGQPLRCKGYFGFQPAWLETPAPPTGAAAETDTTTVRAIESRPNDHTRARTLAGAMAAAIDFLVRNRSQSGLWQDFFSDKSLGTGDVYVSAYVACALMRCQASNFKPGEAALRVARATWERLLTRNGPHDGWSWNPFCYPDADSTAWALRLAQGLDELDSARAVEARKFLLRQTSPDGGVAAYPRGLTRPEGSQDGWASPHTSITAVAAVLDLGAGPAEFLRRTQQADGSWTDYWWDDDEFVTARAVEALRLDASPENIPRIRRARQWAARRIGELGPEGSPFAMALSLEILAPDAGEEPWHEQVGAGVEWLLRQQRADGSFPPAARLRVPTADAMEAGQLAERTLRTLDINASFTTATVLFALAAISQSRSVALGGE